MVGYCQVEVEKPGKPRTEEVMQSSQRSLSSNQNASSKTEEVPGGWGDWSNDTSKKNIQVRSHDQSCDAMHCNLPSREWEWLQSQKLEIPSNQSKEHNPHLLMQASSNRIRINLL